MIFVVTYRYDPAAQATLAELRPSHRQFLTGLHEAGTLIASGPWVGEEAGAYLILRAASGPEALDALNDDPFHGAGLIAERSARGWDPVIGSLT